MKINEITRLMNDHGTRPRIKVYKYTDDCSILVYEGGPDDMDEDIAKLKVNSFTVLGIGYIEIYAQ